MRRRGGGGWCCFFIKNRSYHQEARKVKYIVTDMTKALPGNGSINTSQHATIRGKLCFLCGLRQTNARNNRTSIARQRSSKHASLTKEDDVFRGVRAEELSWRQSALHVQFSVGHSHGNFVVEGELEFGLWGLNVWFEDFMCAVVQWYWECDSYSACIKIRCQETDRENFSEE
jgi:hypothetical protein